MNDIPRLAMEKGNIALISDNAPFLILGGESHNSSASDLGYMEREVWPQVRSLNLNTLLVPVSWELLEPEPGRFDFSLPEGLILQAEREGKKLVFLWFGLWKNGESTYVPEWVKRDPGTYFPMLDRWGKGLNAISPLCDGAVERDAHAFSALLAHLKDFDKNRTVLMVQVENEMGLLGDTRDYSPAGKKAYDALVPQDMARLYGVGGTWREAFGEEAPELFMTYYYAKAAERIAGAGREAYPIPLYVNAWLEQYPWYPGSYPTGGPVVRHLRVWQAFAPSVSFLAPDIYLPDFEQVCREYTQGGNPLFIPEARPCMDSASNVFAAFGQHGALGFSPFAIEDLNRNCLPPDPELLKQLNIMQEAFLTYRSGEFLSQSYQILGSMIPLLQQYRNTPHMTGFTQYREEGTLCKFEHYNFLIRYLPRRNDIPKGGGLIIELSPDEFLLCGMNFQAEAMPKYNDPSRVEYVSITEGRYEGGAWVPGRRFNGDERHLIFGDKPGVLLCRLIRYQ